MHAAKMTELKGEIDKSTAMEILPFLSQKLIEKVDRKSVRHLNMYLYNFMKKTKSYLYILPNGKFYGQLGISDHLPYTQKLGHI